MQPAPIAPRTNPREAAGFVLASSLMIVLLLGSLLALVHLLVNQHWRTVLQVEAQMHSRVLAENGIEYARALLPRLDVDSLLAGADGRWCGQQREWRNPMPLDEARRIRPDALLPACDDGLPHLGGSPIASHRLGGRGGFWVRFSNDPTESPQADLDKIVLVRSLGIVPTWIPHPSLPGLLNSVCLIEARLRQETSFLLTNPLTVYAESGLFVWEGEEFRVEGGDRAAFGGVSPGSPRLFQDLSRSLTHSQALRLSGAGPSPSLTDIQLDWLASASQRRFFSSLFWEGLTRNLPQFDQGLEGRLAYLTNPGSMEISFQGVLFVRGDLQLSGASRISGLLIHLGQGRLTLRDDSLVDGALWLSNLQGGPPGAGLQAATVSFKMEDRASILYSRESIEAAVAALPPTQLGWRIIFPEMIP